MDLFTQVKELTALHQYWTGLNNPEAQAIADKIVSLVNVLLNNTHS